MRLPRLWRHLVSTVRKPLRAAYAEDCIDAWLSDGAAFVYSPVDLVLSANAHELSLAAGGTQILDLDADAAHVGAPLPGARFV